MENKRFTKYHFISMLLILVVLITIIVSYLLIHKAKLDELNKSVVVEKIEEETDKSAEIQSDYVEPDLTIEQYTSKVYEIELDNLNRYEVSEMNKIIQRNVKAPEEVVLELKDITDSTVKGASSDDFDYYKAVFYPDDATIILIYKLKTGSQLNNFVNDLRTFIDNKYNAMTDDTYKAIYKYYYEIAYNGFTVTAICDNAEVVANDLISYMINKDTESIEEFTSKYEVNEYGAYLKEEEK